MRIAPAVLLALVAAASLAAHDLYILPASFTPQPGKPVLAGFHNGDSFPVSEASPSLERTRDTNLISRGGVVPMRDLKIDGKRGVAAFTTPAAGEFLLTLRTIPNFIQMEPPQFLAYLKEEGLQHVADWREAHAEAKKPSRERYSKYAKSLLWSGASDGFFNHEVGFTIEIIPESDPYQVKPGGSLPVRVLFRSKPAADLQLESSWADDRQSKTTIAGRTDSNGRVTVRLDKPGKWRLHALKMERCAEPAAADWESFWASLTFELR